MVKTALTLSFGVYNFLVNKIFPLIHGKKSLFQIYIDLEILDHKIVIPMFENVPQKKVCYKVSINSNFIINDLILIRRLNKSVI